MKAEPASALYVGTVRHRRFAPVPHRFRYGLYMAYLDLDELPEILDPVPFWSARRPAPSWFRRADYLGDPAKPLKEAVLDRVQAEHGDRPRGPVRILTHLRTFGYAFNPVSFYYVFDDDGRTVRYVVAEITNTPWRERHAYVLRAPEGGLRGSHRFRFGKTFHVSPFLDMDYLYDWRLGTPGERLAVHMENRRDGALAVDATLLLERRPLTGLQLNLALVRFPFITLQVIAGIHWQALKLWRKRVPFYPHPKKRRPEGVEARPSPPTGGRIS
jgi:DUF1365 family protein